MTIPLVNLKRQYHSLKPEIDAVVEQLFDSQLFIKGPAVKEFEGQWLSALGARSGVGCANGTAALSLALEALGIGPGDEVITSAHSFFATVEAIFHVGARPVFADIEPASHTLDSRAVESAIGPRTKAIIPVHIHGMPCAMDALMALARQHGLVVVEDAAQAHLARYQGQAVGTIGDAGAFSFYPGKNLGAAGDAGFIVTRDSAAATRLAKLVDHGRLSKYTHDVIGYNQRLDSLQAAVLSVKLPYLAGWNETRRGHARHYDERLRAQGFKTLEALPGALPVYHLYTVEVANREETMAALAAAGIDSGIHYPVPLHLQPAMAPYGGKVGDLPVTERVASRILSLPICPAITADEVDIVCDAFLAVAKK
jgi:dTDP-4-amino-4,6-dideoxygalactose transaminase